MQTSSEHFQTNWIEKSKIILTFMCTGAACLSAVGFNTTQLSCCVKKKQFLSSDSLRWDINIFEACSITAQHDMDATLSKNM